MLNLHYVASRSVPISWGITIMTEQEFKAAAEEAMAEETDQALPTGRCRITVGSIKHCQGGMTQRSCYAVAAKLGGVADWTQGASCP